MGSLEEIAWTNDVKGNLTYVVAQMQEDVVKRIERGHDETQQKVDAAVSILATKARHADGGKSAANQADTVWQTCVQQEKAAMQDFVVAQNLYNVRTAATEELCQREKDTANFSATSGGPVTIKCDTDTDPLCAAAIADLAGQLEALQQQMADRLNELATKHQTAEMDCEAAMKAQSVQMEAVKADQNAWVIKHSECAGKEVQRNTKICHFGEKLQEVCDAKAEYDGLVASTQNSGNVNSVEDRISEWKVTQLVVCLLDHFQQGANLTDQSVEECRDSIPTSRFDLDLKAGEVQTILDVPASPTFQIGCEDREAINFHGGIWRVPSVPMPQTGYDGHVPSVENQTLPDYQFNPMWSLVVSLNSQTSPFALAECTMDPGDETTMTHTTTTQTTTYGADNITWFSVQASDLDGTVPDEKYWHVKRLTVEDCHDVGELVCEEGSRCWYSSRAVVKFKTAGVSCSVIFSKENANNARGISLKAFYDYDWAQIAQKEGKLFLGLECSVPLALKRVRVKYSCQRDGQRYGLQRYVPELLKLQVKQPGKTFEETLMSAEGTCDGTSGISDHTLFETTCE